MDREEKIKRMIRTLKKNPDKITNAIINIVYRLICG